MSDEVRLAVQAALLNSESTPVGEVESALEAITEFAYTECDMSEEAFFAFAREAWRKGVARACD